MRMGDLVAVEFSDMGAYTDTTHVSQFPSILLNRCA